MFMQANIILYKMKRLENNFAMWMLLESFPTSHVGS